MIPRKFSSLVVINNLNNCLKTYSTNSKLLHIGKFLPKLDEANVYKTGRTFLHKILAYRGVILHPWFVNVYERRRTSKEQNKSQDTVSESIIRSETYYQVLIDSRDLKNNDTILEKDGVTFLHKMNSDRNQCLYTIPGIDYVSHGDIIPYASSEDVHIQHDLYNEFLEINSTNNQLKSTKLLDTWQKTHHQCLQIDKVHKETTKCVRITVIPFYLGVKAVQNSCDYWWRYSIRIENLGQNPIKIKERHWQIVSNGSVKTVKGRGVTGKEPVLTRDQPVFQFSSHISIQSSNGTVWGTFRVEEDDGNQFDAIIPAFALEKN